MGGILVAIGFLVVFLIVAFGVQAAVEKFVNMRNDAQAYRQIKKGNDEQ